MKRKLTERQAFERAWRRTEYARKWLPLFNDRAYTVARCYEE
jgi:hypothetical protein